MLPLHNSEVFKPKSLIYALLVLAIVTLAPVVSFGQGSTLERDAYTLSTSASTNFGSATIVRVSGSGSGAIANGYFRFKMTTSLPTPFLSESIAKATAKFYVTSVATGGSVDVYLVSATWAENTITYTSAPANGTLVTLNVPVPSQGNYLVVDLTSQAKSWFSNETTNFGIVLVPSASTPNVSVQFDSKESLSTSHDAKMEIIAQSYAKYTTGTRPAASPSNSGQIIFMTDLNRWQVSDGTNWNEISAGSFSGNLSGEVTGPQSNTVVTNAVSTNNPNQVVRRD